MDVWRDFFQDLTIEGKFSTDNPMEKECAFFCFGDLIQNDLDRFSRDWNSHRMRKNVKTSFNGGRPDILYKYPEFMEQRDCLQEIPEGFVETTITELKPYFEVMDRDFVQYGTRTLQYNNLWPITKNNMEDSYFVLVRDLKSQQ